MEQSWRLRVRIMRLIHCWLGLLSASPLDGERSARATGSEGATQVKRLPALAALLCACQASPRSGQPGSTVMVPMQLTSFEFTDRAAFKIATADGTPCLELFQDASYTPPHRSPKAMAIATSPEAEDFVLEVEAQQTGPEYPHRDLVFVFGWRDAAHFCYAHLASAADANAHHVQLV